MNPWLVLLCILAAYLAGYSQANVKNIERIRTYMAEIEDSDTRLMSYFLKGRFIIKIQYLYFWFKKKLGKLTEEDEQQFEYLKKLC